MLIFNCTKAAQDFFTVTRKGEKRTIVEAPPSKDVSEDAQHLNYEDGSPAKPQQWLLHAVSIKRKHCLVAMEIDTRFSIIVMALGKADVESFLKTFHAFLAAQVLAYGEAYGIWEESDSDTMIASCFNHLNEVRFFKRSDRSVQTQINETVRWLRYDVDLSHELLTDNNRVQDYIEHTNDILRKSRAFPDQDYIYPSEEMFIYWQREYQGVNAKQLDASREILAAYRRKDSLRPQPDEPGRIVPESGAITKAELVYLDDVLLKYDTDTSLNNASMLHGFLTAIVSGPNMLPPSAWMAEVWGSEANQPSWESMEEAQQFMGTLFHMMNDISGTLMTNPQDFSPVCLVNDEFTVVADWCFGYMKGVWLDEKAWEALPDDMLKQFNFLSKNAQLINVNKPLSSKALEQYRDDMVIDAAQELHAYWLKQRSPQKRPDNVVELRPQHPVTSEKVGRNEPCPCGSGKKFKKCCLH